MSLPITNHDPGFRITRASHVVLDVRDLAASRRFYENVIGLILTAEEGVAAAPPGPRCRIRAAGSADELNMLAGQLLEGLGARHQSFPATSVTS
ncbi:VOC family protein [Bradyrhizobium sp. B097]|uniref:VOC family protein n=1 Tax=Bradyrhizobium sp. B097 TaxID=3140244 RepID=UPI0031831B29